MWCRARRLLRLRRLGPTSCRLRVRRCASGLVFCMEDDKADFAPEGGSRKSKAKAQPTPNGPPIEEHLDRHHVLDQVGGGGSREGREHDKADIPPHPTTPCNATSLA